MSDTYKNLELYSQWDNEICINGAKCDHPLCEDHNGVNYWDKKDWPVMGDPWWDSLQSQSDYRRMMHYFDVRGGTANL